MSTQAKPIRVIGQPIKNEPIFHLNVRPLQQATQPPKPVRLGGANWTHKTQIEHAKKAVKAYFETKRNKSKR